MITYVFSNNPKSEQVDVGAVTLGIWLLLIVLTTPKSLYRKRKYDEPSSNTRIRRKRLIINLIATITV
jgi:hypothetical protein